MNKAVERIAKERIVEGIVTNVVRNDKDEDYRDLINEIYLTLLEKDEEFLNGIYERNQIQYFITRIVLNNINSKTSPYYYKYRRWTLRRTDSEIPEVSEREKFDSEE